jgi:hypothetical protein
VRFFFRMSVPSLFGLAAKQMCLMQNEKLQLGISSVPKEVVEGIVPGLDPLALSEFIASYGGMLKMKNNFSTKGFQKFYLHYWKTMEKDLHYATRKKLIQQLKDFQVEIEVEIHPFLCEVDEPNMVTMRMTVLDWCVGSLGIFNKMATSTSMSRDMEFLKSKFNQMHFSYFKMPVPSLPDELVNLLPQDVDIDLLPTLAKSTISNLTELAKDDSLQNQFFNRLLGMSEAYWFKRDHELLAYGFELLSRKDFFNSCHLQKYFLNIYGMMAESLARLKIDYSWCMSFLNMAKKFVQVPSQSLDILHYQQKIYFYWSFYPKEFMAFSKLFQYVPAKSKFSIQSFKAHFYCFIIKVENYLFQALCIKKAKEQNEEDTKFQNSILNEIKTMIREKQTFVHQCLGKPQPERKEYELALLLLEVYSLCTEALQVGYLTYEAQKKIKCLSIQFTLNEHFAVFFFQHMADPELYHMFYFNNQMDVFKTTLEKMMRFKQTEHWANTCFTLFLLFEIIAKNSSCALDWLHDGEIIYKKFNASRYPMCLNFKNKTKAFTNKRINFQRKQCDLKDILKSEPTVAAYTKLGIMSIINHNNSLN